MLILDTNILSEVVKRTPHRKIHSRLRIHAGNFAASMITLQEIRFGAMLRRDSQTFWEKIEAEVYPLVRWIDVDLDIAMKAGDLEAHLQRIGKQVGIHDCLIAATALVSDCTLVTRNTKHFEHMPDLQLENWFK